MQDLTEEGQRLVEGVAQRNGFSTDAVLTLLRSLVAGHGNQAQFNHFEFGGMGQWSRGGMIMIGDMFNNGLKYRVDALCNDLSSALGSTELFTQGTPQGSFVQGSSRWPRELGNPGSSGSQNDMHYAFFPRTRRLAIEQGGKTTIYDTGDHQIGGVSQQQGGDQTLSFTSQLGTVRLTDLPIVSPEGNAPPPRESKPEANPELEVAAPKAEPSQDVTDQESDVFQKIERLADLRTKGILSDTEFQEKKAELLARL